MWKPYRTWEVFIFFNTSCSITGYTVHECEAVNVENKNFQSKLVRKVLPVGIAQVPLGSDFSGWHVCLPR